MSDTEIVGLLRRLATELFQLHEGICWTMEGCVRGKDCATCALVDEADTAASDLEDAR